MDIEGSSGVSEIPQIDRFQDNGAVGQTSIKYVFFSFLFFHLSFAEKGSFFSLHHLQSDCSVVLELSTVKWVEDNDQFVKRENYVMNAS